MAEVQVELTPEEETRTRWEQLLRGKPVVVDDPVPPAEVIVEVIDEEVVLEVAEDSPESVLAQLFKSMKKA